MCSFGTSGVNYPQFPVNGFLSAHLKGVAQCRHSSFDVTHEESWQDGGERFPELKKYIYFIYSFRNWSHSRIKPVTVSVLVCVKWKCTWKQNLTQTKAHAKVWAASLAAVNQSL